MKKCHYTAEQVAFALNQTESGTQIPVVCQVLCLQRSSCRYRSVADEQAALRIRLRDLASSRVSYGYRRLHILLQREGWQVNHKRVYRHYRKEGLQKRPKQPRALDGLRFITSSSWNRSSHWRAVSGAGMA